MKLIIAIAFLTRLAFAQKYAAGDACHTNIECNNNCVNSQWTVANQDGEYALVCDPALIDTPQYYTTGCYSQSISGLFASSYDPDDTRTACNKLAGQMCRLRCVLTGKKSTTDQVRNSWADACSNAGSHKNEFNDQGLTREQTEKAAGCGAFRSVRQK